MALDATRLGNAMADAVIATMAEPPADDSQFRASMVAIATEIITEITTNAQATGTANVTFGSSAGVHAVTVVPGGIT